MYTRSPITRTGRDTYRQTAQVLGRAFMEEAVSLRVYRGLSPAKRLKNLIADFTAELMVCIRRGEPVHISQDGKIAASAVIYPPGRYPPGNLDEFRLLFWSIWGHSPYDIKAWFRWLKEAEKHHPLDPHYYLLYLGVEPALQGKGLGSMLLEHLTAKADEAKVGCYLETASRVNLPLYQRHGFEIIHEEEIIGLPAWFMWRNHRKVG